MGEEYAAPDFVKECVAFLREHGASVEGIFRITGSSSEVSQLQKDFDEGKLSSIPESTDPHVVAGLLKIFFRQLPEPLLTYELYEEFTQLTALENSKVKIQKLSMLISHLPPAHYATLQALSELLVEVAKNHRVNLMTAANLGICFGPNLLKARVETMDNIIVGAGMAAQVVALIITHHSELFVESKRASHLESSTASV
eukprot:TRINITY_DN560_c0_g2_i2.p1 TRINITY_DN560_c0_g2~~TRINITY_DN560_c0_g2_i2.p1  ORF type:complete len:199 (+),score=37.61 TRINITY_DN560_c0_g2_i2:302-898(+)